MANSKHRYKYHSFEKNIIHIMHVVKIITLPYKLKQSTRTRKIWNFFFCIKIFQHRPARCLCNFGTSP